jgi:hypothetical protein
MKRKYSDFSTSNVSEQDINIGGPKKVVKEDAIKTFCRIKPDKYNKGIAY